MDTLSKKSTKCELRRWVQVAILPILIPVVDPWGTGAATKHNITKPYPPPGR